MNETLDTNLAHNSLELDNIAIEQLAGTRKWTFFLAIGGFSIVGLLMIIFIGLSATSTSSFSGMMPGLAFIPMLIISSIYFFPLYFLYQFSRWSKIAISDKDTYALSESLRYLKMHFKFMGILFIIILGIYALAAIIGLITGSIHLF